MDSASDIKCQLRFLDILGKFPTIHNSNRILLLHLENFLSSLSICFSKTRKNKVQTKGEKKMNIDKK